MDSGPPSSVRTSTDRPSGFSRVIVVRVSPALAVMSSRTRGGALSASTVGVTVMVTSRPVQFGEHSGDDGVRLHAGHAAPPLPVEVNLHLRGRHVDHSSAAPPAAAGSLTAGGQHNL